MPKFPEQFFPLLQGQLRRSAILFDAILGCQSPFIESSQSFMYCAPFEVCQVCYLINALAFLSVDCTEEAQLWLCLLFSGIRRSQLLYARLWQKIFAFGEFPHPSHQQDMERKVQKLT